MAEIYTGNEPGKIKVSMTQPKEVKGQPEVSEKIMRGNNNSRETLKSTSSSKEELEKINDPEIVSGDDEKTSDDSTMTITSSESEKITRETETRRKFGKSIEYSENPEMQRFVNFLRGKNISENLICGILKNRLCDGFDKLLQALGITNEEMTKSSWQRRIDYAHPATPSKSSWMLSDECMSPDNLYLKKHFGDILVQAMKEIVRRKPCDPVDFLCQWLINRRICNERETKRKEFENELCALRKLTKDQKVDQQSEIIDHDEREESLGNDWNYQEYEESEMP